jgi:hypothetical protein
MQRNASKGRIVSPLEISLRMQDKVQRPGKTALRGLWSDSTTETMLPLCMRGQRGRPSRLIG